MGRVKMAAARFSDTMQTLTFSFILVLFRACIWLQDLRIGSHLPHVIIRISRTEWLNTER